MATTPLGLPLIPDNTRVSAFPAAARDMATALDDALANHTLDDRGLLLAGTDLNTITTAGFYRSDQAANVATLKNTPAGTKEPFSLEVRELSRPNRVYLQTLTEWTSTGPKVSQRLSNEAIYAPWTLSPLVPWARGILAPTANLDTLTNPGVYDSDRYANLSTISGRPAGVNDPFTLEVRELSRPNGVYLQTLTAYSGGKPKTFERLSFNNVYPAWEIPSWTKGILPAKTDLDALTAPGVYDSDKYSNLSTMPGRPAGVNDPFTLEVRELSRPNGVYLQTLTAYSGGKPKTFERLSLNGTYPAWELAGQPVEVSNRTRVTAYGDSLTAGGTSGDPWVAADTWPSKLGALLPGVTVTNQGRGGDTTDEVLIRAGALVMRFTVPAGSIPASGAVQLATRQKISTRADRSYTGTLAGVPGVLKTTNASGGWQFTRSAAGAAVPVSGQQPFLISAASLDSDTLIFWAGRNDVDFGTSGMERDIEDHVIAHYQQFLDWARPRLASVVLVGLATGRDERAGSAKHVLFTRINDRLRSMFPGRFIDVQRWLVNDAIRDLGLTPTAADKAAAAAGEVPPQLFADTVHFTRATAAGLARFVFEPYLQGKGLI